MPKQSIMTMQETEQYALSLGYRCELYKPDDRADITVLLINVRGAVIKIVTTQNRYVLSANIRDLPAHAVASLTYQYDIKAITKEVIDKNINFLSMIAPSYRSLLPPKS